MYLKTDITVIIHDQRTNQQSTLGFGIKSQLANPSTLLNASKTTNFVYQIHQSNLTVADIDQINKTCSRNKIKDRISYYKIQGRHSNLQKSASRNFLNNLILVDGLLL